MAGSNNILSDGGFATGTGSDVTVDGVAYTFDSIGQEIPVTQADAYLASGLPKGGAFIIGKQKHSVKCNALIGTQRPSQLVPFQWTPPSASASSWWCIGTLKINSANTGAVIRTYDADVIQLINTSFTTS